MPDATPTTPDIPPSRHVLIAGPTASGKSALALDLARSGGGIVVNADAAQVYANWRLLTARPSASDLRAAPHALYGHIARDAPYSAGHWLREVDLLLKGGERLIVTGGTGLYFAALTEGLAEIPEIPANLRAESVDRLAKRGLGALLADLDSETLARIDRANPRRVQRAWEVLVATGRGLADWQDTTPPPLLAPDRAARLRVEMPRERLNRRIERRFDAMLAAGVLEEARANLAGWDPSLPSMRAIGAAPLIAHLRGEISLAEARERAITATRQYAKRQRTWQRARMKDWQPVATF